jgi:SAM-dependent methyltransferase
MPVRRNILKKTFDTVPTLYDSRRPGYPAALIKDILRLSHIPAQGRILEIGCGTGQATKPFADRGYQMTCLDIGTNLAAMASRKFQGYDNVTVIAESFESWNPKTTKYHLAIAATSFHWLDPAIRYTKVSQILCPDGSLAVFSNVHVRRDEGFFAEVQSIYRKIAPPRCQVKCEVPEPLATEPGVDLFEKPIAKRYPWDEQYTAEQYIALLGTYSDHINLPKPEREELFRAITELINANYKGVIIKHYESMLEIRRKKDRTSEFRRQPEAGCA